MHPPILYPGTGTVAAVLHKTTETESPAKELVDRSGGGSDDQALDSVYTETSATPLTLHDTVVDQSVIYNFL